MKNKFSKRASTQTEIYSEQTVVEKKPFNPTSEQVAGNVLVKQEKMIKFNAVAGSGKSSSLYYFGRENNVPSLGLVFNKSMATEANSKSPSNIEWMTTHSLAYRKIGRTMQHKLSRPKGRYVNVAMTGSEIAMYFKLPDFFMGDGEDYISQAYVGLIIKDTVNMFEIGVAEELSQDHVPYLHIKALKDRYKNLFPAKKFVKMVVRKAGSLWEERKDIYSDVMATHNTYLKLYQLTKPNLSQYQVIYLDESQDLNPVTMDIVLMQKDKCKIVLVGDKYQSIYQFNGAINALENVNCKQASLTKSFRFGQDIADIAKLVLGGKLNIIGNEDIKSVVGGHLGVIDTTQPYTILFRTNMELIFQSVKLISAGESVNVNTDLKDFVALVKSADALYQGEMKKIKHENILPFTKWEDLIEEGKSDRELGRVSSIVENNQADEIIETLHKHENKHDALITLTSAHKSKGLEWKQVILGDDFPSNYNRKGEFTGLSEQEENLLYVAVTRAEIALQYNSTVQELIDLKGDTVTKEEKLDTSRLLESLNEREGALKILNLQSKGGAEQAGYELQSVAEYENQRDTYANASMSEEDAFDKGIIDSSGITTESVDQFSNRIEIHTKDCIDKELWRLENEL